MSERIDVTQFESAGPTNPAADRTDTSSYAGDPPPRLSLEQELRLDILKLVYRGGATAINAILDTVTLAKMVLTGEIPAEPLVVAHDYWDKKVRVQPPQGGVQPGLVASKDWDTKVVKLPD